MKVLVVEDSPDDAELLCEELAREGESVAYRRVECEEDMRAALEDEGWDIVISDHAMPCFSAMGAWKTLQASGKDIPFVIYTGHMTEQAAISAMNAGVPDFVLKSSPARLLPLVRREIRNAAARSAQAAAESNVYRLSNYDDLTGLANRHLFCQEVDRRLAGRPAAGAAAILLLNIDRFTEVNHTVGFQCGDRLLRQAAERLRNRLPPSEIVARLGGDRFAIFVGCDDRRAVQAYADSVLECFESPFLSDCGEIFLTLSIGIAVHPDHGVDVSALLVNAESASMLAKRVCGSSYRFYMSEMGASATYRVTLESGLRHALERDELLLRYQPIVELATERITGTEALIRWNHPEMGMVPPERFIPLADETGLITGIGAWVLGEACAQVMRWQEHGERGLSMAVNVSARQFADKSLLAIIDRVLEERRIDPQLIDIEITESALMEDVDAAVAMLKRLKRRGIRVSVDDFGTGYSSLNYLKRFPVDTLKVDKTFTRDAARNADDHAIVRAIIALSRSLHLRVVAEGIETVEQLEVMRREGCDYVQGNLYGRPMAPAEVSQLIASRRRRAAAGGNELHLKAAG